MDFENKKLNKISHLLEHYTHTAYFLSLNHLTTAFAFVHTEATDPLTYTVTAFEFFVLQTT
jgi:hypothetical protein